MVYKRTKVNYRQIWMEATGKHIPAGHEIHHVDGNSLNNDRSNLDCLSILQHAITHYDQGNFKAADLISFRLNEEDLVKFNAYKNDGLTVVSDTKKYLSITDHLRLFVLNQVQMSGVFTYSKNDYPFIEKQYTDLCEHYKVENNFSNTLQCAKSILTKKAKLSVKGSKRSANNRHAQSLVRFNTHHVRLLNLDQV